MEAFDTPAPRRIGLAGRLVVLLRGPLVQVASPILGIGLCFVWTYVLGSPLFNPVPRFANPEHHEARIFRADVVGALDEAEIVRYLYEYEVEGVPHVGRTYATEWVWEEGGAVRVEVDPDHPEVSRVPGGRSSRYEAGAENTGIMALLGAALLGFALWRNGRKLSLLRSGRLTRASVTARSPTIAVSSGGRAYRLQLRYRDEAGEPHQMAITMAGTEALDAGKLPVVHLPGRPRSVALARDLEGLLEAGRGGFVAPDSRAVVAALLVPGICLLPHVAWGLWRLFSGAV